MKRSKKILLAVLGVLLLAAVIGGICIGRTLVPTVNHALRISELLQPLLNAENQTMHIAVSAEFDGSELAAESDVYRVKEEGRSFLAIRQENIAVYVADDVLFLENGKAFALNGEMGSRTSSFEELLPGIGVLYETLKITAEETDSQTVYSVAVTGEQAKALLEAASFGETLPMEGVEKLKLQLTERDGKLDQISFSGSGNADAAAVRLQVALSGFRILAPGDYPIPEAVKQSAATVDPEALFSLTEDLYRLVLALAPLGDMESIEGTLALAVDCGPLQLDTQMDLSDLKNTSGSQADPEILRKLPEMLGLMCMEGNIHCIPEGNGYLYTLALDQPAMQELARMILPELSQYSGDLTDGSISIVLEAGAITAMGMSIHGKINALLVQIPIEVEAVLAFG